MARRGRGALTLAAGLTLLLAACRPAPPPPEPQAFAATVLGAFDRRAQDEYFISLDQGQPVDFWKMSHVCPDPACEEYNFWQSGMARDLRRKDLDKAMAQGAAQTAAWEAKHELVPTLLREGEREWKDGWLLLTKRFSDKDRPRVDGPVSVTVGLRGGARPAWFERTATGRSVYVLMHVALGKAPARQESDDREEAAEADYRHFAELWSAEEPDLFRTSPLLQAWFEGKPR